MKNLIVICLFMLFVAVPVSADKVVTASESAPTVVMNGKTLQMQNIPSGDKIEILSIVGVKVLEKKPESSNCSLVLELPRGYYIVKIGSTVRKISVK